MFLSYLSKSFRNTIRTWSHTISVEIVGFGEIIGNKPDKYVVSFNCSAIVLAKKMWNASRFCVSSLRRGHANLLCIVPILVYVFRMEYINRSKNQPLYTPWNFSILDWWRRTKFLLYALVSGLLFKWSYNAKMNFYSTSSRNRYNQAKHVTLFKRFLCHCSSTVRHELVVLISLLVILGCWLN